MFLDDLLYEKTIKTAFNFPKDYSDLINSLFQICGEYLAANISINSTAKDCTILIDKIGNFWNSFINKLKKENWFLIDAISKINYKEELLRDEKVKLIYLKGKF